MYATLTTLGYAIMYAVACLVELFRVFKTPRTIAGGKTSAVLTRRLTIIAIVIQTFHLASRVVNSIFDRGMPLANWSDWCLLAAWLLALTFLLLAEKKPAFGLFLLPLTLTLIGISTLMSNEPVFQKAQTARALGMMHGIALLVGTVTVLFGFAAGVMYLLQARRLKYKKAFRVKLPSLEYLQKANERSLVYSALFLMIGIITGFVLNVVIARRAESSVPLTDPTVVISAVLAIWLIVAWLFSAFYRPVKHSRKVAYLTVASFVAFALTLGIVLFGPSKHARERSAQLSAPSENAASLDESISRDAGAATHNDPQLGRI